MTPWDINQRMNYLGGVAKKASRLMRLGGTPKMKFKNVKRGRAHPFNGYFTIPMWSTNRHLAYSVAYVIHELTHFSADHSDNWFMRGHGKSFRQIESEVAEKFGLRLVYRHRDNSCYLHEIRDLETRRVLCGRFGESFSDTRQYDHPACLI